MAIKTIACFLSCFVCLILARNISAQQSFNLSELAGTYSAGHQFGGSSITLKPDGTYSDDSGSCTFTTAESGTYVLSDGILRFTILKYTGRSNRDGSEVDLLDTQAMRKFYDVRDDETVEPIKTEYSLVPVRWGERIYLIFENDLKGFSNAINLGLEPRLELSSEVYYGLFYLREGDEKKDVSGKPSLPAEWQSFLLSEPVTAKIVDLEEQDGYQVATINKGSQDGLKVGMKLVGKDQEPLPWAEIGMVISVEEKSAKVKTANLKIGDSLSSKYAPRDR